MFDLANARRDSDADQVSSWHRTLSNLTRCNRVIADEGLPYDASPYATNDLCYHVHDSHIHSRLLHRHNTIVLSKLGG